jgi:hypothetical protein
MDQNCSDPLFVVWANAPFRPELLGIFWLLSMTEVPSLIPLGVKLSPFSKAWISEITLTQKICSYILHPLFTGHHLTPDGGHIHSLQIVLDIGVETGVIAVATVDELIDSLFPRPILKHHAIHGGDHTGTVAAVPAVDQNRLLRLLDDAQGLHH